MSQCTLTLSIQDQRLPTCIKRQEFTFYGQQTADEVNELVSNFFNLKAHSDKALFASAFHDCASKISFTLVDDPNLNYVMELPGDQDRSLIIHPEEPGTRHRVANRPDQKIAVTLETALGVSKYPLTLRHIRERADDLYLTSLFNSRSFGSMKSECTHGFRLLQKIPLHEPFENSYATRGNFILLLTK
jgi:hypothetical protein